MKPSASLAFLLPAVLPAFVAACGGESANVQALRDSREVFDARAAEAGDIYTYSVYDSSWTGQWSRTWIDVWDGVVVSRYYEAGPELDSAPTITWSEDAAELGSHPEGEPAMTMPELYERCETEILVVDPSENDIYFELDGRELLETCVYVPHDCADDCSVGIRIETLGFAERCDSGADCG